MSGIVGQATCPECGRDVSRGARLRAAAQRVVREGVYRAIFFGSPALGLFAGVAALLLAGTSPFMIPGCILLSTSAAGIFAVWRTQPIPEHRRLDSALVLGPIMALVYLGWLAAVAIVWITSHAVLVSLIRGGVDFPSGPGWLFVASLGVVIGGAWLIRRVLRT